MTTKVKLQIGKQSYEPTRYIVGAGFGVRYLIFELQSDGESCGVILDDLVSKMTQDTTYFEDEEEIFRGRTIEIWQDMRIDDCWWVKVEIDAFG